MDKCIIEQICLLPIVPNNVLGLSEQGRNVGSFFGQTTLGFGHPPPFARRAVRICLPTHELGQTSMQPLCVSLKHLLYSWLCDWFPGVQGTL